MKTCLITRSIHASVLDSICALQTYAKESKGLDLECELLFTGDMDNDTAEFYKPRYLEQNIGFTLCPTCSDDLRSYITEEIIRRQGQGIRFLIDMFQDENTDTAWRHARWMSVYIAKQLTGESIRFYYELDHSKYLHDWIMDYQSLFKKNVKPFLFESLHPQAFDEQAADRLLDSFLEREP